MAWSIFVWVSLPSGLGLVALFCSGQSLAMWLASKVLSAPVQVGTMQLSLGAVMTAISILLAAVTYSQLQRAEARAVVPSVLRDQQMKEVFLHGRNLYISLLSLTAWAVAWRLKALYDSRMLGPPAHNRAPARRSPITRGIFMALGCLSLLLADIPLCRINYNMMLAHAVTPRKTLLIETSAGKCNDFTMKTAGGECAVFCEDVRKLAQERLETIKWARKWHVLGNKAAILFDGSRGVEQGEDRINDLFNTKTCAQVLRSVDKSNRFVNFACYICATIAVMGSLAAFAKVFTQHEERDHQD